MNPRTTGILFLVAAALAAFVYFYEIRGGAERAESEAQARRLFPGFKAEEITEISLTTSDGRVARAVRRDSDGTKGWDLVEPLSFPGDAFALDGMASALADLKSEAVFEKPQPAAVYGLDDDRAVVHFKVGDQERSLRLGKKAPMGSNSYASIGGSDAVYTVSTFALNSMRKSLDDLREKRIARFDRNAIDHVSASWPGGRVVLAKGDDGWHIKEPVDQRADAKTVDSLLSDLSFLRADGFVDDPPDDAKAGLAPPDFAVELAGAGSGERKPVKLSLAIGSEQDGSRLVRAGQPSLFRIPADRLKDLPRQLVAYRWKEIASFAPTDAAGVELHFEPIASTEAGDQPVTIKATRSDKGWTSEPEAFAPGKVAAMISKLSKLRAHDILADEMGPDELAGVGLEPPLARIVVRGAEGEEPLAAVRIGSVRPEGIVAQRDGMPTVFELDSDVAEKVPVSLDAFREQFAKPKEPEPEQAQPTPPESAEPEAGEPGAESP